MIILDSTNKSLEVLLDSAVSSNEAVFTSNYVDISQTDFGVDAVSSNDGQTNGTTAVTIISAPSTDTSRQVKYVSIYNADTDSIVVTVQVNNNSTVREVLKETLSAGRTLEYTNDEGWKITNEAGTIESVLGGATTTDPFADTTNILGISNTGGFVKNTWANIKAFFVNVSDIVDNLTTTDTNKPLSANQGKQLNDSKADLTGGNTFSGVQDFDGRIDANAGISFNGGTDILNAFDPDGTFTPTYEAKGTDFDSVTYDIQNGFIFRVGDLRIISGQIRTDSITKGSASGNIVINLPVFISTGIGIASCSGQAGWSTNLPTQGQVIGNELYLEFISGTTIDRIDVTDMSTGANSNRVYFQVIYRA